MRLAVTGALTFAALVAAAPASATLVYQKGLAPNRESVWVAANDGSSARRIARGESPHISPDGETIFYQSPYTGTRGSRPKLMVIPAAGGTARVVLNPWLKYGGAEWSADSKTIAAVTGPEIGAQRLVLIDVATGARRTIAKGVFAGLSFSPAGDALAYARAARDRYPLRSDIFSVPLAGGPPTALTSDRVSSTPVWGPTHIVFAVQRKPPRRHDAYKQDLYLMKPTGAERRRLTRTRVGFLLSGLSPMSWSVDGSRLLAQFGGQDTNYAETVDPSTGRVRMVGTLAQGIVGAKLSSDGTTILATTGGYEPGPEHDVVSIPYEGKRPRVLARGAFNPDWNR
jgi:Tol biopolymer transport system component